MVAPTLVPLYRGGLRWVMEQLWKLLIRPRVWVGRDEQDGSIEDILVYRGDVYLFRDPVSGVWVAEIRGPGKTYRHELL